MNRELRNIEHRYQRVNSEFPSQHLELLSLNFRRLVISILHVLLLLILNLIHVRLKELHLNSGRLRVEEQWDEECSDKGGCYDEPGSHAQAHVVCNVQPLV